MCGFVALWKIDDPEPAHRTIARIAHRGPDDVRVSQAPNVPAAMAHCRLSIIGLEDGTQSIYSAEDVLVANGEIYNYADLRAILGESAFETQSDSETISAPVPQGPIAVGRQSRRVGVTQPVDRGSEGRLYERLLREQYQDPDLILDNAGTWTAGRVAV